MRSKAFLIGLAFGVALFVAANVYSYIRVVHPCCDLFGPFGVPFELGGYGGFAGQTYILWGGVLANAAVALLVGVVLGWACQRLFLPRGRLEVGYGDVVLHQRPNNGMHPTADTKVVKFHQRPGAAGDAGR